MSTETTTGHPLRVGVVGLGWAGQQHLEAYSKIEGVEVVGLAGMEDHLREELSTSFEVPHTFASWEELLELEQLDAVSVAVPTFLHAPIAVAALKRGLHVLGEKPLARNSEEGREMVEAAQQAGRVLDVAFNHRRRGDIQKVRGTIASGEIGDPYYAKASWLRRQGIPTLGSWFTNKELSGGGPLADLGVHVLDYALFLLGEPKAVSVTAATYSQLGPRGRGGHSRVTVTEGTHEFGVEDFASAFIRFEDGATLVLESGWAAYRETDNLIDFMVYGSEGGIELRAVGATKTPVGTMRVFADQDGENADYELSAEPGRNHQQVVEDFVETVRGGPDVWSRNDGTIALERAKILDACYLSAEEKREVRIDHG